ncbi:MAG TPA: glycosyltransferase family 2 protein [Coriobacteriia bacterium]|nr:glycosyltransferase family 2 protein [Coriobacteriia bacterium]
MDIAVLIPAHEEAERIGLTVAAALEIPGVTRVVVVDDGSRDDTADRAEAAGAKAVRLVFNVGKGTAMEAGASRVSNADIVLMLDGDLAETAGQAAVLLAPVLDGEADMSVAAFPRPTGKAGFGLVKRLARFGISKMGGGFDATAPLSGQRAMTGACFEAVRPFASGYGVEVALTVRALRQGFRIVEVPTTMAHAATGRDLKGFVHRGKQFVHVSIALTRLAFEKTPPAANRG